MECITETKDQAIANRKRRKLERANRDPKPPKAKKIRAVHEDSDFDVDISQRGSQMVVNFVLKKNTKIMDTFFRLATKHSIDLKMYGNSKPTKEIAESPAVCMWRRCTLSGRLQECCVKKRPLARNVW